MIARAFVLAALLPACLSEPEHTCSAPRPLTEINTGDSEFSPALSNDRRSLYWAARRPSGGANVIWRATRPNAESPFSAQDVFYDGNGTDCFDPVLPSDGSVTFVCGIGTSGGTIYTATPEDPQSATAPSTLPYNVLHPTFTDDMRTVYYASKDSGDFDLYVATRASTDKAFGPGVPLDAVNDASVQAGPVISGDGKTLYFQTTRYTQDQQDHIYVATAPDFTNAKPYPGIPTTAAAYEDLGSVHAAPGQTIVFESNRDSGNPDIWIACE
jgi:hypothetical protein